MFLGASSTYVECLTIAKLTHIGGQKKTAPKMGRYPNLVIQKTEAVKSQQLVVFGWQEPTMIFQLSDRKAPSATVVGGPKPLRRSS